MNSSEQSLLLDIVKTWNISESPEYRGFRCANCQEYKNIAWYHWVTTGGFRLPIHLCDDTCEKALKSGELNVDKTKQKEIDRNTFGKTHSYTPEAVTTFRNIVSSWPDESKPLLKAFTCDLCEKDLDLEDGIRKGWHVWWNTNGTLTELHFHKACGASIGIL